MKIIFDLFYTFFKLGLFTFGGGYAMIPQMKDIVVEKKHWLEEQELLDIIAISESTPGPIAINMATFIGYRQGKVLGSMFATLGVVMPSLIIIYIISLYFNQFIENQYIAAAFVGIKCAVGFLILKAGLGMFKKLKKNWFYLTVFGIVFTLMIIFEIFNISFSSIILIMIGGALGIAYNIITTAKKVNE